MLQQTTIALKVAKILCCLLLLSHIPFYSNAQNGPIQILSAIGQAGRDYEGGITKKKPHRELVNLLKSIEYGINYAYLNLDSKILPTLKLYGNLVPKGETNERQANRIHYDLKEEIKNYVKNRYTPTSLKNIKRQSRSFMKYGSGYAMQIGASMIIVYATAPYPNFRRSTDNAYFSACEDYFLNALKDLDFAIAENGQLGTKYGTFNTGPCSLGVDDNGDLHYIYVRHKNKLQYNLEYHKIWYSKKNKRGEIIVNPEAAKIKSLPLVNKSGSLVPSKVDYRNYREVFNNYNSKIVIIEPARKQHFNLLWQLRYHAEQFHELAQKWQKP
ncbi:hypothetical protein BKI52_02500 [marine bacterium AO1-C]|nr:hypothetical protein BKI52_02500 [marine bacterium AO1-C]